MKLYERVSKIHMKTENRKALEYGILTMISMAAVLQLLFWFLGISLADANSYNTYALQADSWRQGRLDLGQDYPWLELAIYRGKYFCSFPPFPSYILFPLTFIFGSNTPDYVLMVLFDLLLVLYLYRVALKLDIKVESAMILTLFVTIGSNTLFIMVNPGVWFFAQLLCFLTTIMAIYYAYEGKGGVSFFFWAASVGCRPMQILFFPVLALLLIEREKRKEKVFSVIKYIKKRWYWAMPPVAVAISYMLLNYLRFGSVLEFGRKYLPEFMRSEKGQFHVDYMKENLQSLLRMPQMNEEGEIIIDYFGNMNFMMVSPIILVALGGLVFAHVKKDKNIIRMGWLIVLSSLMYILFISAHRTLGGWQFGNRYTIDVLPYIFLLLCFVFGKYQKGIKYCIPFWLFGMGLNILGTVIVSRGW